jgi:hypothetical protein
MARRFVQEDEQCQIPHFVFNRDGFASGKPDNSNCSTGLLASTPEATLLDGASTAKKVHCLSVFAKPPPQNGRGSEAGTSSHCAAGDAVSLQELNAFLRKPVNETPKGERRC